MDVILDRGSTPLTSIKYKGALSELLFTLCYFYLMLLKDRTG